MKITKINDFPQAEFEVNIVSDKNTVHLVSFDKNYYHELTAGKVQPEELVRISFNFLLDREPNTSVLSKFNLKKINQYFPEYENYIKSEVQ